MLFFNVLLTKRLAVLLHFFHQPPLALETLIHIYPRRLKQILRYSLLKKNSHKFHFITKSGLCLQNIQKQIIICYVYVLTWKFVRGFYLRINKKAFVGTQIQEKIGRSKIEERESVTFLAHAWYPEDSSAWDMIWAPVEPVNWPGCCLLCAQDCIYENWQQNLLRKIKHILSYFFLCSIHLCNSLWVIRIFL